MENFIFCAVSQQQINQLQLAYCFRNLFNTGIEFVYSVHSFLALSR